ncbi:MAG: hypothetical protein GWO39_13170, partial [Gammaproteobacteria bacterium]|nr:hypothetical protein [Gammaproteobacteria bacterium]NIT64676.1 hypothetical protein [Gammaproteobacteria bacterium]NIV21637.1 hypothetical protein [Gammaproteobacteria bacterium]NIY33256.1 hypothetical protein [Gammaproteobacteria bacterium]
IERLSPGFSAAAAAQRMEGLADAQEALPYYAAAIRETLEEARVLLAEPPADTERALPT